MREFKAPAGFLVFAQNNSRVDYLRLAYGLALSLKLSQKTISRLSVAITPGMNVPDHYREIFDQVIDIPWGDDAIGQEWKLANEWKAYHLTPYETTVKLEADMLFLNDISHWWDDVFLKREVFFTTRVNTYRGHEITSRACRQTFDDNQLPNVYTGLMSFRYCDRSERLFDLAELIYQNWELFSTRYLVATSRPTDASTDVVFALAVKLLDDPENYIADHLSVPSFTHMKAALQGWPEDRHTNNWMDQISPVMSDDMCLRIGRYEQSLPFHYHEKTFLTDRMIAMMEKKLA